MCTPFAGMEGHFASPTGPATGRGGEQPVAHTRHRPIAAPRLEEKTISRLSAVHVGDPMIGRLSNVRRFAAPPRVGITNMSLLTPATVERMNVSSFPSGENIGLRSIEPAGGDENCRMLKSASDSIEIQERVGSSCRPSQNASSLPSGDQEIPPPIESGP